MADNPTLEVQVVSPEEVMYQGAAEMVVCRTTDGDIAFLPGHMPFLGALGIAKVRVLLPGEAEHVVAVHGGFVEVSNNRVLILSDVAELPADIDVARAEAARQRARDRLAADEHDEEAAEALTRADLRLEIAGVAESSAAS
jgi:F-type H+-transporting ATPase subunit epsilon